MPLPLRLMPFSRIKYGKWLRCTLLLSLYALLFIVQLFCITSPDSTTLFSTGALSFYESTAKEKSVESDKDPVKKTRLCITKRFHHTLGDIIVPAAEDTPRNNINYCFAVNPTEYLLISFIVATSLRGPPVAISHVA